MSQESRKKKFNKLWFVLLFVCAGGVIFHKPLLLFGCKTVLKSALSGRTVFYEKMQWEDGAIAISGLNVKDLSSELTVDRIELKLSGEFFKLRLTPQITVLHPQIFLAFEKSTAAPALPFLYRSHFIQPRWEIKNGVLALPSSHRFYFSMEPGREQDSMGSIAFSHDSNPSVQPMLSAELSMNEGSLQIGFKLQETQLHQLLPLTALIMPEVSREWKKAEGEVEFEGLLSLSRTLNIRELHCHGSGKKIDLQGSSMGISLHTDEIAGAFSYPDSAGSLWDKLSAAFSLKNGACQVSAPLVQHPFGMSGVEGELKFEPKQEPKLKLNGKLLQQDRQMSFALTGKGGLHEDQTFWSEVEIACQTGRASPMQALLSFCSYDQTDLAMHLKIEDASFEHLDFFRALGALPGQCVEGMAVAEATLLYKEGHWQKASVENCHLDNIRWYFPEQQVTIYAEQVSGDSVFEANKGSLWSLEDLHFQLKEGDYLDPHFHLTALASDWGIEKGALLPSHIKGSWGDLQGEVAFENGSHAKIMLQGNAEAILNALARSNSKIAAPLPIVLQADVEIDKSEMHLKAEGTIASEEISATALFSFSSVNELLLGKQPRFQLKEGSFQSVLLTEKSYRPVLAAFFPDLKLSGNLQCKSTFSPERVQCQLSGEKIAIEDASAALFIPQLKEKPAQFTYDVSKKQWRGEFPIAEAEYHQKNIGLHFVNAEGVLKLDADHLKASSLYAECSGLAMRGSLDWSLSAGGLSIATSQIAGDMKGLLEMLAHFPALPKIQMPIEGNFSSGDKGLVLTGIGTADAQWSFKGSFDQLRFPVNPATGIVNGRCDVLFDSKSNRLVVEKGEGTWLLKDGMPFTVSVKRFSTQGEDLDFALKVADGKKEFAHFEGKAAKSAASRWEIVFDGQSTHFGGTKLNITRCHLSESLKPLSFEMAPILRCQDLHAQAAFLQNAGFLPPSFSAKNLQEWQLEGTMQAQVASDDLAQGFSFYAESRDLKVKGKTVTSFHLSGQKIGEKWLIEKLEAGHLSLKAAFLVDSNGLTFPQFEGKWLGMSMKGSGYLKTEQKRFSCTLESLKGDLSLLKSASSTFAPKGTFLAGVSLAGDYSNPDDPLKLIGEANLFIDLQAPLPLSCANVKAVKFSYGNAGLVLENLDFQLKHRICNHYLGNLKAAKASHLKDGDLSLQQLQFSLTTALFGHCLDAKILPTSIKELEWEGDFEGSGDLLVGTKGNVFQGTLKPGNYGFGGKLLPFDQLHVKYEKEALSLRCKTKIEEQPLWASLQVDISKDPFGVIRLLDNPKAEGLKLCFKTQAGRISWESLQGSCYGLNSSLNKNSKRSVSQAAVLSGEVKVDANLLCSLLPSEIRKGVESFKFGKGYQWQGDLVLFQEPGRGFQANGTLLGIDFEAFGYQLHHLEGTIEAGPERILINNVKINDPAGAIVIKKIELTKQEDWQLYIPQVQVRQLQPSMLYKVDGDVQVVKPFTIKNFTMAEIRGRLGDKSTLEGSGHLSFTNQFKKEASIFDVPLEMIKKIGLDPGLLTPVQGELEIELRGDKFYLMSLKDSMSEGNRAEFYLAAQPELSYIDLDGKIHIDLNMRQDVVLKITEPFTLTIRGTLDKPRYGLQF